MVVEEEELVVVVAYMDMVVQNMAFASLVVDTFVVEEGDMVVQHIQELLELELVLELDMVQDMVDIVELEVVQVMEVVVVVEELDKDMVALHMESLTLVVHTSSFVVEVVVEEEVVGLDMGMAEQHMAFASLVVDTFVVVGEVEGELVDRDMVVQHMVLDNMVVDMLHLQLQALVQYIMGFVQNIAQIMLDMHIVHL